MKNKESNWPYANEVGQEEIIRSDVLVLGGGLSGCFAAIAAARSGLIRNAGGKRRDGEKRLGRNRF